MMNGSASGFRRAISANERLYLSGARLTPPFAIQILVEGEGSIDLSRLERAVADAAQACPGARLVARGRDWVDSGRAPRVRVVDGRCLEGEEDAGHRLDQASFLRDPLDPREGPTCEVLLLQGARPRLVFRAFHGVMDGKGALVWVREVFRALRGEPLSRVDSTQTDLGLLKALGPVGRRPPLKPDCPSPLGAGRVIDTEYLWARRTLRGTHPALVAKLAAILVDASGLDRARFMVPVDMRRHDGDLCSTANLSLPIFLDVRRGERWDALHERLLAELAGKRELSTDGTEGAVAWMPLALLTGAVQLVLEIQRRTGRYLGSGILSHLGRLDLASFSGGGFTARTVFSLPVHVPLAPLSLVAVECADHVELTLSCPRGDGMDRRAERLLDQIEATLSAGDVRRWGARRAKVPFPSDKTVTQLFRAQAARTPDAVALVCGGASMTYRELDARSDVIAAELKRRGAGRGAVVGLLVDRNEGAMIGLWGILKAGAAYLPIDPQYPEDRIRYLLTDAKALLCVADPRHAERLATTFSGEVVLLGAPGDPLPPPPELDTSGHSADLAYVIYTSGSTGRPKGVQVEHRSLVNYLTWASAAYGVDGNTRFALFTSLAFDLSVTSFLLPLLAGGSVALFPGDVDHLLLREALEQSGVNALKITPTHLDLITRIDVAPSGYRAIIVGGEQLKGTVAAKAQEMFGPQCRIVNEYGPTEATVGCIYHVFDARRDGDASAVPIGVPGDNTTIYLLDREERDVDPEEIGEIYIAGDCLARGYLDRPDLDRDKFIRLADGTRAYRSGDLARFRADGILEFLGRTDHQIKIRGHRIEPGEIEAALEQHPKLARAVVLGVPRPGQDDKALCAYYVCRAPVEEAEIRSFLEERLPRAMVPSLFVAVDEIPVTVNGKVDVRALPSPFGIPTTRGGADTRRDEVEALVLGIWSELLALDAERLDPEADFYRLGGDSLKLVEMLAAVAGRVVGKGHESAFMRDVRPVIRKPTLESVCRAARQALGQEAQ